MLNDKFAALSSTYLANILLVLFVAMASVAETSGILGNLPMRGATNGLLIFYYLSRILKFKWQHKHGSVQGIKRAKSILFKLPILGAMIFYSLEAKISFELVGLIFWLGMSCLSAIEIKLSGKLYPGLFKLCLFLANSLILVFGVVIPSFGAMSLLTGLLGSLGYLGYVVWPLKISK
jgi:hypothetical protein